MNFRVWLAYAFITGSALSGGILPRTDDDILQMIRPENVSAATTEAPNSKNGLHVMLPSLYNASQKSSNYSSLYDLSIGQNLTTADNAIAQCSSAAYGSNLDRYSCFDAWRNIGLLPERLSWGPRRSVTVYQRRLPSRWSSGKTVENDAHEFDTSIVDMC